MLPLRNLPWIRVQCLPRMTFRSDQHHRRWRGNQVGGVLVRVVYEEVLWNGPVRHRVLKPGFNVKRARPLFCAVAKKLVFTLGTDCLPQIKICHGKQQADCRLLSSIRDRIPTKFHHHLMMIHRLKRRVVGKFPTNHRQVDGRETAAKGVRGRCVSNLRGVKTRFVFALANLSLFTSPSLGCAALVGSLTRSWRNASQVKTYLPVSQR